MELDLIAIGKRIAEIRRSNRYTMSEFGKLLGGVNKSAVNNWEKGRNLPEQNRLDQIALIGRTSVTEILYGDFETYTFNVLYSLLMGEGKYNSSEHTYKSDEFSQYLTAYVNDEKFLNVPEDTKRMFALHDVSKNIAMQRLSTNITYGQDDAIIKEAMDFLKAETQPKATNHGLVNMITSELSESITDVDWLFNKHFYDDKPSSENKITPEFAKEVKEVLTTALQKIISLENDYQS